MLVTKKAPNFKAEGVSKKGEIIRNYNFKKKIKNNNTILFFWPLDFTFVCPSEIIALNNRYDEFKKRNTNIIGISIDSIYTHIAWRNTPIEKGGIGKIKFIMISDLNKKIQNIYNVKDPNTETSLRATFLVDKKRIIRYQSIYDLSIGRNIDEILRITDAVNHNEKYNKVCPAQWNINKKSLNPDNKGITEYLSKHIKDLD